MGFGGNTGRPQGFGQAAPQGYPVGQPGASQGGGQGYPGAGYGVGPGAGPTMPMAGGMPVGGGRYPGGMYPGGMNQGGAPQGMFQGMPQGVTHGMTQAPGFPPRNGPSPSGPGMAPGGSLRNTLGAGLKSKGIFKKDGKLNNSRGGFIGPKQGGGGMEAGPFSFLGQGGSGQAANMPRQLILEPSQAGIAANGIATITPDNMFTCIANLPSPNTLSSQGYGTYAAYLVDEKGSTGFLAGILRPVGSGVYQTQFRSQVPLMHYTRVLITLENPQQLAQVPNGPIVLQVKQSMGASRFLVPVKKAGGSIWQKISGFVRGRGNVADVPGVPLEPLGQDQDVPLSEIPQSVDTPLPPIQQ